MEKTLGSMMKLFMSSMSADNKQGMNACIEKMSSMCSCLGGKDIPEEDKNALVEKIRSFCCGKTDDVSDRRVEKNVGE
jgi:hypothetical protein